MFLGLGRGERVRIIKLRRIVWELYVFELEKKEVKGRW